MIGSRSYRQTIEASVEQTMVMSLDLRGQLAIPADRLAALNAFLDDPSSRVVGDLLEVVARYGTPDEINRRAHDAGSLPALRDRLREVQPSYLDDLDWLIEQRDRGAFVSVADFRRGVLGGRVEGQPGRDDLAVTLEVSALQYFPWLISAAKQAIDARTLMPGRWIRVRKMKEQEADGDLAAVQAAMQIIGASVVETLDTKGTDGSNVHLDGPATITGYFGGVGEPNDHPLRWADELLYYYTNYGVRQVLNLNPGTVLVGYFLYRLGIDIGFKISVFMGNDNPYAALWTMIGARLFARDDGTTPLVGFNWSNSVDNGTIEIASEVRRALGFEDAIRFEHHITETWKSIVRQPYDRRDELVRLADHVPNISAKHEGGDPAIDSSRPHPSDILDYFRDKAELIASGDWDACEQDFLDKVDATNHTARALTEHGLGFVAARNLHR
jgi:bifunctional DNA-binding transcriptional regulator/antitoxin component of YhaV-PrlF toxin-antitoxin module